MPGESAGCTASEPAASTGGGLVDSRVRGELDGVAVDGPGSVFVATALAEGVAEAVGEDAPPAVVEEGEADGFGDSVTVEVNDAVPVGTCVATEVEVGGSEHGRGVGVGAT